ncbi:MAG: CARDB domain-containing protein [Dehalococcoidia bacterium]
MLGHTKVSIAIPVILLPVLICLACSQQPQAQPASFQVVSLGVMPAQVQVDEEATVVAQVTNTGKMAGNYTAELSMNGEKVDTKTTTIQPEKIARITFTISRDKPGTYEIQLESASTTLTVTAMEERDVELKYDSGVSQTSLWAGNNNGFLISFSPPAKPFILKKVSICGAIYGVSWEGKIFELSVLDQFYTPYYKQLYAIARFPVRGAFPYQEPPWVDFEIPPTHLENDFLVYLFTGTGMHKGIQVGVDNSFVNEHSDLASGRPPNMSLIDIDTFYNSSFWYSDRSKVNWMIRATGSARLPVQ